MPGGASRIPSGLITRPARGARLSGARRSAEALRRQLPDARPYRPLQRSRGVGVRGARHGADADVLHARDGRLPDEQRAVGPDGQRRPARPPSGRFRRVEPDRRPAPGPRALLVPHRPEYSVPSDGSSADRPRPCSKTAGRRRRYDDAASRSLGRAANPALDRPRRSPASFFRVLLVALSASVAILLFANICSFGNPFSEMEIMTMRRMLMTLSTVFALRDREV